jgi:cell division inhibitor SepF
MAGALRKTMVYLGLAEDDDRYDDDLDHRGGATEAHQYEEQRADRADRGDRGERGEVGPLNRITTIHPRTYNEAKTIGESFRDGTPVIMNLSDMGDADAKRLVDFAAGLVFGLHGTIERVTSKVFLLSPAHVEVASEEPEGAPSARGFFNQS